MGLRIHGSVQHTLNLGFVEHFCFENLKNVQIYGSRVRALDINSLTVVVFDLASCLYFSSDFIHRPLIFS